MRNLLYLLLVMGWLAAAEAGAQARGPPATEFRDEPEDVTDPAVRTARLAEMDEWLRRLAGRFHDSKNSRDFDAEKADCKRIGPGAGVQCFTSMRSLSYTITQTEDTRPAPEARLFGVDANLLRINFLQVNSKGLPEGGLGRVSSDTLHIRFKCLIPENERAEEGILSCEQRLRIRAAAGSREVGIASEIILRYAGGREETQLSYLWMMRLPEGDSAGSAE